MIRIVGDVHGEFWNLRRIVENTPAGYEIIQVGDFGLWPHVMDTLHAATWPRGLSFGRKLRWIDGNHEYFPLIPTQAEHPVEMWPDTFYMPRGSVAEIDGRRVGFLGGAESIDASWRQRGVSWFPEESITYRDIDRMLSNGPVDILVTHTPTYTTMYHMVGGDIYEEHNRSARAVEGVWEALGRPLIVSGHVHQNYRAAGQIVLGILNYVDL